MGKFLGKGIHVKFILKEMRLRWNVEGDFKVTPLFDGLIVFSCSFEEVKYRILAKGPQERPDSTRIDPIKTPRSFIGAVWEKKMITTKVVAQLVGVFPHNQLVMDLRPDSAKDSIKFKDYPLRHVTIG